ncbi:MAG TPA: oxygenase MpaB family protein [Acidimicrobiales bacterium]|nr:oxygenase MpaB family protein [Acidimicrobiales bacterium]
MVAARPDRLLRNSLDGHVHATLGDRRRGLHVYREPRGDAGWFGPDSMTWKVHSRLGPMLVGGISALLLQTLHPLVVQGVADHSNYREDPLGRLQRTADFIALTTYGSDAVAARAVQSVRTIHGRVRGTTASGQAYRATDPALLTYVHVTEVWSFLRAYQRYSQHPLLATEKNQYLAEVSIVARRLGARAVPESVDEVRAYLREIRPELRRGDEAKRIVGFLLRPPQGSSLLERAAHRTIIEAGIDLLPSFARRELGFVRPVGLRLAAVRPAAAVLSEALHWSVGEAPMLAAAAERVKLPTQA